MSLRATANSLKGPVGLTKASRDSLDSVPDLCELEKWYPGCAGASESEIQVLDFFSGCGGMSLGFAAAGLAGAGFRVIGAVDINEVSSNTFTSNFGAPSVVCDVREIAASQKKLEELMLRFPEYDPDKPLVLIGCAPCQGFSAHRKTNWDAPDHRNSLVEAFAEVAVALRPACVVMENVPELLSGKYREHFDAYRDRLDSHGFTTKQVVHNAAQYGTPQARFRALIISMDARDFALPSPVLEPKNYRTVRDAIGGLPKVEAGVASLRDPLHKSAHHRESTIGVIKSVPKNGGSRPVGIGPACLDRVKGFSDVYGRLAWDKPSITITHYARNPASGRFVHPVQDRGLTMREVARLQGFPDSFVFTGKSDDVYRQIGEAVPPPMAIGVAKVVATNVQSNYKSIDVQDFANLSSKNSFSELGERLKIGQR